MFSVVRLCSFLLLLLLAGCAVVRVTPQPTIPLSLQTYLYDAELKTGKPLTRLLFPAGQQPSVQLNGADASWLYVDGDAVYLKQEAIPQALDRRRIHFGVELREGGKILTQNPFTMLLNTFASNRVIAHRGAWKKNALPQNSLASLQQAIALGCEGSEFDVHLTADSVLVVNHDPEFLGLSIEKSRYADLLQKTLSNGETIPTLEAYLKAGLQQQTTKLILEIKASVVSKERTLRLTKTVVDLVHRLQAQAWVEYISFDYDALKKVRELDPAAKTAYLQGNKSPETLKNDGLSGLDYHYMVYQKHPEWIKEAHQVGLTVNAWTVNDPAVMDWLLAQQADLITTNEPEILLKKTATSE